MKEVIVHMNINFVVILILALFTLYFIGAYNGFIILKTRIAEALSGIDVQLKRRADLIPGLLEAVKGYAKHEKGIFENVTRARAALVSAQTLQDKADANNQISQTLKSLFAVAEAYPELKADSRFKDLQKQLEDTEDKIAYARQFYNSNVLEYNARTKAFPTNVIANTFGFAPNEFFQATAEEREKIEIKF